MVNTSNIFAVYCDGGICNRLNALITAKVLAKKLNKVLTVYWPINTWCCLDYNSIFNHEENIHAYDSSMLDLNLEYSDRFTLFAHEQQLFSFPLNSNPNLIRKCDDLCQIIINALEYKSVLYFNSVIPYCIPLDQASFFAKNLPFLTNYPARADEFVTTYCLASNIPWSIHLRGTDFGFTKSYYDFWYFFARHFPSLLLLMTDDIALKNRFSKLPNVRMRSFQDYPTKLDPDLDWVEDVIDSYGRKFSFNIQRSGASVKESLIDLFILSQSKLILNSNSTFLVFAMLIRGYKFSLISYCYFNYRRLRQLIKILRKNGLN